MSKDEIEHSKKIGERVYWDDLVAAWSTTHVHFAAPNTIAIDTTKVTANDEKSTLYSNIDSSIVPQNLIPSLRSCY